MSVAVPFKKNSQTKKNYTKTATFPTAILLVAVLQPYNLYQHLQFPSLSIGNCGSPNLRCGPAVPSSLDSSPLLRCCLALCCSASVELGSTSSCKKAGKAIWMTTTFSNLKTKEVFSSKWDFEQQLQMCMYIYSMHNYILLHTITYSYIYISLEILTFKNIDWFCPTNWTSPRFGGSARSVLLCDSRACEISLHHQSWASNVGIFANDHHHIPEAKANAMLHQFNNIPTSLLLHERTANLKFSYKKSDISNILGSLFNILPDVSHTSGKSTPLFVWQKKILIATCSSTSPLVRRHRRVPHSNASPKPTPTSPQWSVGSVGEESTVKTQRLRSGPWDDRFEAWIWDKKKEATQKMTKTKRTKCSQSFSGHKVKVEILNKNR